MVHFLRERVSESSPGTYNLVYVQNYSGHMGSTYRYALGLTCTLTLTSLIKTRLQKITEPQVNG